MGGWPVQNQMIRLSVSICCSHALQPLLSLMLPVSHTRFAQIPLLIYSSEPIRTPIPTPILIYTLAPPRQHVKGAICHDPLI